MVRLILFQNVTSNPHIQYRQSSQNSMQVIEQKLLSIVYVTVTYFQLNQNETKGGLYRLLITNLITIYLSTKIMEKKLKFKVLSVMTMTFDLETQINIHRNIAISKVVSKLLSGEKGQIQSFKCHDHDL